MGTGRGQGESVEVLGEAGMEPELMNRLGKLSFSMQVEAFYTAYSKVGFFSFESVLRILC